MVSIELTYICILSFNLRKKKKKREKENRKKKKNPTSRRSYHDLADEETEIQSSHSFTHSYAHIVNKYLFHVSRPCSILLAPDDVTMNKKPSTFLTYLRYMGS